VQAFGASSSRLMTTGRRRRHSSGSGNGVGVADGRGLCGDLLRKELRGFGNVLGDVLRNGPSHRGELLRLDIDGSSPGNGTRCNFTRVLEGI
jgi:hypothetical protein